MNEIHEFRSHLEGCAGERPREVTAAQRANAPVPVALSGYDRRRIASSALYAIDADPYAWFAPERAS